MVNGIVISGPGVRSTFHALRDSDDPLDVRVVDGFLARFGGISFRLDSHAEGLARFAGLVLASPGFMIGSIFAYARSWLRRVGEGSAVRGVWRLTHGAAEARSLVLVSHHFMSTEELGTPLGRERLAHCVFHVPVNGEFVSMCEVNALGVREQYYADLAQRNGRRLAAAAIAP